MWPTLELAGAWAAWALACATCAYLVEVHLQLALRLEGLRHAAAERVVGRAPRVPDLIGARVDEVVGVSAQLRGLDALVLRPLTVPIAVLRPRVRRRQPAEPAKQRLPVQACSSIAP